VHNFPGPEEYPTGVDAEIVAQIAFKKASLAVLKLEQMDAEAAYSDIRAYLELWGVARDQLRTEVEQKRTATTTPATECSDCRSDNTYKDDSQYCRKCGLARFDLPPGGERASQAADKVRRLHETLAKVVAAKARSSENSASRSRGGGTSVSPRPLLWSLSPVKRFSQLSVSPAPGPLSPPTRLPKVSPAGMKKLSPTRLSGVPQTEYN